MKPIKKTRTHSTLNNLKQTTKTKEFDFAVLNSITDRAFYLALQMIHIANHRPEKDKGEPKVGGHPSACASSKHILSAIHLVMRQPEDYLACKPHVSPMDHALNFFLHNFRNKKAQWMTEKERIAAMRNLRHFSHDENESVFQSYHAESDPDGYRFFPSGSVGIPPVNALYMALAYRFAKDHGFSLQEDPWFWCLMGDSEFREGSLHEAMPDAAERNLGKLIWIVDYNRQNLDGTRVLNEKALGGSDADRIVQIGHANGWHTIKLKHGKKREALFQKKGGEEFRRVLDEEFTDFEFQALLAANQAELTRKTLEQKSKPLSSWLQEISNTELQEAFLNLGGHDLESLLEAFTQAKQDPEKPTLIVAYTIKGHGLECQALSGNHSAMPEEKELRKIAESLSLSFDEPFQDFLTESKEAQYLAKRRTVFLSGIEQVLAQTKQRKEEWHERAKAMDWPVDFSISALKFAPLAHTQWMWGQIAAKLDRLARHSLEKDASKTDTDTTEQKELSPNEKKWQKFAPLFLTMAPDVGSSTNTSPNMNGKLYGEIGQADFELQFHSKDPKAPDVVPHSTSRTGHLRFEIAEGNAMSASGSFGKMGMHTGIPFFPAMTIYDFFIKRAHDQFYYNLYWHSSFATIGTPSGVTLAPEGAQHSWKSDFQIPNCITWEPCFAKELEWILADTLRRHFTGENQDREGNLIRCVTKGLTQKEFLHRLKQQNRFRTEGSSLSHTSESSKTWTEENILEEIRQDVLSGGYVLIDYRGEPDYTPGDNVIHIFAMGALGQEAVLASDELKKQGIFANVFIVTSPDLLLGNYAEKNHYMHLRQRLGVNGNLHFARTSALATKADWFSLEGSRIPILSVHDGEPGLLDNIGSVVGVLQNSLAIRKTSKSGTCKDIYGYHGIDTQGITQACLKTLEQITKEKIEVPRDLLEMILGSSLPKEKDLAQ